MENKRERCNYRDRFCDFHNYFHNLVYLNKYFIRDNCSITSSYLLCVFCSLVSQMDSMILVKQTWPATATPRIFCFTECHIHKKCLINSALLLFIHCNQALNFFIYLQNPTKNTPHGLSVGSRHCDVVCLPFLEKLFNNFALKWKISAYPCLRIVPDCGI
jgi:hypothetical protein